MNSKSLTCRKLDADMNNKKLARKNMIRTEWCHFMSYIYVQEGSQV